MSKRDHDAPREVRVFNVLNQRAAIEGRERLNNMRDSNAEYQRRGAIGAEERKHEAKERLVGRIKTYNDFKAGRDTSESEARKKAEEIASRYEREHD